MLSEESRFDARATMQVCSPCDAGKHESNASSLATFFSLGMVLSNLKMESKYCLHCMLQQVVCLTFLNIFSISLSSLTLSGITTDVACTSEPEMTMPIKPHSLSLSTTSGWITASTKPPPIAISAFFLRDPNER